MMNLNRRVDVSHDRPYNKYFDTLLEIAFLNDEAYSYPDNSARQIVEQMPTSLLYLI